MKKGVGVSTHTKTVRQNGVKYRYVYVLDKIIPYNKLTASIIEENDHVRQGERGVYLFKFDHCEKSIECQLIYDHTRHTAGRPVGSKDSYKRARSKKSTNN